MFNLLLRPVPYLSKDSDFSLKTILLERAILDGWHFPSMAQISHHLK